jgi:hypothetical protein
MKKLAIGCLVVAAVLVVALGVGSYFLYRAASPYIAGLRELGEIAQLDRGIANTADYSPPDSGELTEEAVRRFVSVQEAIEARLRDRVNELRRRIETIDRAVKDQDRDASPTEILAAMSGLAAVLADGKRAQVEALNKAGFSRREYEWVRRQVYQAAGLVLSELNFADPESMARAAQDSGGLLRRVTRADAEVPARNKALVAPYVERLKSWLAFGMAGL